MITIRLCQREDRDALRGICLATSSIPVKTRAQRAFLYGMYCDHYAKVEWEHCFVAVEQANHPIGYILCAPDYARYRRTFCRGELLQLLGHCPWMVSAAVGELLMLKSYAAQYPAHLHIDILEQYQRQGVGQRLMDALLSHLREEGVPGVMLCVGASNEKGISFYQKYGFRVIKKELGGILMGMRL